MKKIKSTKAKIAVYLGIALLLMAVLFFLLRGPYLSNFTKRLIIPTLENATRERIIMDNAVINLFPFYIQAKGVKVFDREGNRLLWITKTRAYIDLTGLFLKEIRIRKFTLKEPRLEISGTELKKVVQNVKAYMARGKGKFKVSLRSVELTDGDLLLADLEKQRAVSGSGMFFKAKMKDTVTASLSVEEAALKLANFSEISGSLKGNVKIEDNRIEVQALDVRSLESTLKGNGEIFMASGGRLREGSFTGTAKIYASTFNELFNVEEKKDGVLSFDGTVGLLPGSNSKWPRFSLDLNTDSRFYLETLMQILKVRQNVRGEVSVNGRITGTFPAIKGTGKAELSNAVFAGLPLDDVKGDITYENSKFTLNEFTGAVYEGILQGDAHISVPSGDYSVAGEVSGINSPEFFRFIEWEPPFPKGKIKGNFRLDHKHGQKIMVSADLDYRNVSLLKGNLLDRLESMHAVLELEKGVLRLKDSVMSTSLSDLYLDGTIDLNRKTIGLDLRLESGDIADLTSPYYSRLNAPAKFTGKMSGPFKDPEITGDLEAEPGSVHGIAFTHAYAGLRYRAVSLTVNELKVMHERSKYNASGEIEFRKAEGLFSFKGPFYRMEASVENADLKPFIRAAYKDIPVSGSVSGLLLFEGDVEDFKGIGDLTYKEGDIYGQKVDEARIKASLRPDAIEFRSVKAFRDNSDLDAKGTIFFNKEYNVSVSSGHFDTCDIDVIHDHPLAADVSFDISSSGTFDDPKIEFSVNVLESYLNHARIGSGEIYGKFQDKRVTARANLIDRQVAVDAGADLSGKVLWNADLYLKEGRYDFLLSSMLTTVPEDLSLSLEGGIKLKGEGANVSMRSRLTSAELFVYGYNFINDKDIELEFDNNQLMITSFSLTGDNADFSASGLMKLGEDYNLMLKGKMDMSPLKVFTDKVESLKGRGNFELEITGKWKAPELLGNITVDNVMAKLSGFQYKIGPVNGTLFFNKNKFNFDNVRAGFAGGTVTVSGAGYFDKLALEKIYLSSTLDSIRIRPIERVNTAFDGKLFYEKTPKGAILTGNIDIKKAKYSRKVKFSKLLVGFNEIKKSGLDYMEFLGQTELNIRISGTENIFIDNNIAKTPVKIDLNLMGNVDQKGLIGRVEADEGSVFFRGNEFKILEGSSVEFVSPNSISPIFHVLAETYVSDYFIKLSLDGTMDNFTLSLFSDPPLSEMDILTLLTFGQVNREKRGFESGMAASEAASILTGDIQEAVEERFKDIADVDRFVIEPHATASGSVSPKVTVGKRVLEDKLSVIYSTSVGTTEEHIVKLKYSLNKNISIVGSRDEIGSTGVDLKYRFEFK